MDFNKHSDLSGRHAVLSPSSYHWLRYDLETLESRVLKAMAAKEGTRLHQFAQDAIELQVPLHNDPPTTLGTYVNDAIEFGMTAEQPLRYSNNAFGTADAISFKNDYLRIHDLKTGHIPGNFDQLRIYVAYFCLEYVISPHLIGIELRLYQGNEVIVDTPYPSVIAQIMDKVIYFDQEIERIRREDAK